MDGLITRQALQQEASVFAKRIGPSYRALLDGLERLSTVGGDTQLAEGLALHQLLSRYLAEHPTSGLNPALDRLRAQLEEKLFAGDMLSRREDLLAVAKESPQLAVRLYQLARETARSGDSELTTAALAWARADSTAALARLNALVDAEPGKTWRADRGELASFADDVRRATGRMVDAVDSHALAPSTETTHAERTRPRPLHTSSGRMDFINRVMEMPDTDLEEYLVRKDRALKPLCDYVFRGVDLPDGRFGRITSQFVSKQHLLAFSVASNLGNFAVSAREAGALTLERLADGAAAKGHDILEKTVKGSSLSSAYGAEGVQKLAWLQELGLAGLVGHWDPETKALLGFYVTPELYAQRDSADEVERAVGQRVLRVDDDHYYYPVDISDAASVRSSTALLRESPQWQQKMYTGDYDLHDMVSFSGRAHSVPSSSQTERFIRDMLNAAVAAKDESRPLRRGSHHTVQHGPQVSYPAHMGAHEQGEPLVGAVANPSFPLALCDRGVWQPIVHDVDQLQGAYRRMGAHLKVTWQPGDDHPRFVPDGENGQVRMVRRLSSDAVERRGAHSYSSLLEDEVSLHDQRLKKGRGSKEALEALGGRQVAKDYLNKFDNVLFFLPNSPNYGEQAINSRPIREISESLMGEGKKLVVLTNEDYNFKQRVRLGLRVEGEDANRFDAEDFLRFFAQSEVDIHKDANGKWSFNYPRDMVASETNQFEVEDLIERYRDELRGRSGFGEALDLDIKLKEFHSFTEGKPSNDESFKRVGSNIEIEFTHQLDYISAREKLMKLCPGVEDKVQFLDLTESDGANFRKLLTEKSTLILSGATDTRTSIFESYGGDFGESTRVTEIMMGDKDHGARRGVYVNGKEVVDGFPKGIEEGAIYPSVVDKNAIDRSVLAEADKANLRKLLSHVSDVGMLYTYGFHQVPIENRQSLLDGMRNALIKSEAGRRAVIFIAGDVGIPISSESMDCVRVDDAVRFEVELSKETNKPLVVLAGQLPSDVNDLLVLNSRLVIAEGKGTISFCQQNNIRHLILRKREGGGGVVQVTQYHDSGDELLRKELELRSEDLYSKDLNLVKNTISDVFLDVDDYFIKNHYKNMSSGQNLLLETLERIGSIQKVDAVDNDRHKLQSLSRYQENVERSLLDISTNLAQWRTEQVTSQTRGETASRFDGQLIFQMENDPVAARAAARLAGKHPGKSVLVQVGADGQYRVVHGELSSLSGKLRWQVVGHGREDGEAGNSRLSGYEADSLAARLLQVSNDIARVHGIETQAEHVSLVGCSLVGSSRQDGYARGFFEAMERRGAVASVSARSSEVAVDS
ncbi:C80 family cysteine peptidase, partial [Chromobacterium amazonense]|uniref:C80 family cysteine peptidase n=1 Tax=Chromobacterium amazonense TaxID=1382803 RepID=UPI00237E1DFD